MAKTEIVEIRGRGFPDLTIPADTFVVWKNSSSEIHSAETTREANFFFNAGAVHPGESTSPVYFGAPGKFPYLCRFHHDMTGVVNVTERDGPAPAEIGPWQLQMGRHGQEA